MTELQIAINFYGADLRMTKTELDEAINVLATGSAICFLGAGFSHDAKDSTGKNIPTTEALTEEVCNLIGIPRSEGGSLSDVADYCQADSELALRLNTLLINRLTHCAPTPQQMKIAQVPWRSIFTTNFDDIVERALPAGTIQVITPASDATTIVADKRAIYYLHGRALDLLENKRDPAIVLSESNYLELKQRNANLHASFLNELHCAKRIFFIGYSLRDTDIAKRLFSISDELRSKSVVVCGPDEGVVALGRLQKFGAVHPIGLVGLAKALPDDFKAIGSVSSIDRLQFVRREIPKTASSTISREDIDRLIISGEFDYSKFAGQKNASNDKDLYCIEREHKMSQAFDAIANGTNRLVVSSDIGNGKSVFLDQLTYIAHKRGYEVFRITSQLPEMYKELEFLLGLKTPHMFVVDDLVRNRNAAEFIGARLSRIGVLVCATRDALEGDQSGTLATSLGGIYREVDLNELSNNELKAWEVLLERWGLWEARIALDEASRLNFLKNECGAENRSIIVSVFRSSQIAKKIDTIVSYFLSQKPAHLKAFVAILICSLCQKHVEWARVIQWLHIDEHALRTDIQGQAVFNFMSGRRDWYKLTSPQLADHIFKKFDFDDRILVDVYTNIVRETAYSANDRRSGFDSKENLKELMKFRFLTRIFGDGDSALASIEAIYARLSEVPRIRGNDQFWLQYAMSSMEREDVVNAETYIKTALGIAKKKGADYSDHQILDQRARVFFLKNAKRVGKPNPDEILTALGDLEKLLGKNNWAEGIHPIRSATFILQLVNEKADRLEASLRERLLGLLGKMQAMVESKKLQKAQRGEIEKLRKTIRDAILVLKNV